MIDYLQNSTGMCCRCAHDLCPGQHRALQARVRLGVDVGVILTPPLYILYKESLMKYTGWYQNDFNVQG
jgi:hypothetical protein